MFPDETFDELHYERKVSIVSENAENDPYAEYSDPPNSEEKESKHFKKLSKISKSSSLQPIEEEIFPEYSPRNHLNIDQKPEFSFANKKQVLNDIVDIYNQANKNTLDLMDTKYMELYSVPAENSYED